MVAKKHTFEKKCSEEDSKKTLYVFVHVNELTTTFLSFSTLIFCHHIVIDILMDISFLFLFLFYTQVPCNTFHAPNIFNACVASSGGIQPIHIIRETVEHIRHAYPDITHVGVMCTTGTRSLRLYHDLLEKYGYHICEVSEEKQNELHCTIYDQDQGIKAKGKTIWSTKRFTSYAASIVRMGAEIVILGCTEIPIVLVGNTFHCITKNGESGESGESGECGESGESVPLVDPLVCGARALIRKTYPMKLKKSLT